MEFDGLTRWTERLDRFLRRRDFTAGRTAGGSLDRRLGIRRHTWNGILLPAAVCFFAVLATPNPPRFALAAVVACAVFLLLARKMRSFSEGKKALGDDLYLQLAVVAVVALAIWIFASPQYSEWLPYAHLLLPLTVATVVALLGAGILAERLFQSLREQSNFAASLRHVELFANPGCLQPVTFTTLFTSFCMAPFRAPIALLLPPAIAALLARPEWVTLTVLASFAVSFAGLVFSGLNERYGMMWLLLDRAFTRSGSLLVSLVVIALAAARFLGVTYVTTVFDTAAGWAISTVLVSIYVLSGWFVYWVNRLLSDQLLRLLNPRCVSGEVCLPYTIDPKFVRTHVPADGRVLQLHESSRLIVIREADEKDKTTYFQSYGALDLLEEVAFAGAPGGRADPTYLQIQGRAFTFRGLTTALLALLLIGGWLATRNGRQDAELETSLSAGGGISPAALFTTPADDHTIFVVAASGGGTRAALFTAAILEGMASRQKAGDVVLASGVSGGGAALAYFGGFRRNLITYDRTAWSRYYDAMKASYIRDVLERALEWRMLREGRLGMLLRESFSRQWGLNGNDGLLDRCSGAGDGCSLGLIFNTTLAGRLHLPSPAPDGKTLAEVEPAYRPETSSSVAGGRLILTNLDLKSGFAGQAVEPEDPRLPVVIRGPSVHLEHAAALNANFPPVFTNAAIDANRQDRYWVTDGGAADNRGMEMALYAIYGALKDAAPDRLPRLHIVVADAGAYSEDYVQDRGVSSALGAGAHFASALDAQLKSAVDQLYVQHPERFQFSYVYMPRPLRASGSFGTHWMLQGRITVHQKHEPVTTKDELLSWFGMESNPAVTISGEEMVDVLRSLYVRAPFPLDGSNSALQLSPKACQVLLWARDEDSPEHSRAEWLQVAQALGDTAPDSPPACRPE